MKMTRFNPLFVEHLKPRTPQEDFVKSILAIDGIIREASRLRTTNILDKYTHDMYSDYIEKLEHLQNKEPHQTLSLEEESNLWRDRLKSYGHTGLSMVNEIDKLKISSSEMAGSRIDFLFPRNRQTDPTSGFITDSLIDYAPFFGETGPALCFEVSARPNANSRTFFPILAMCDIAISDNKS